MTNESAGMGSYNFDAHYSHRGPCLPNPDGKTCRMLTEAEVGRPNDSRQRSSVFCFCCSWVMALFGLVMRKSSYPSYSCS